MFFVIFEHSEVFVNCFSTGGSTPPVCLKVDIAGRENS